MARTARIKGASGNYHIILRGINKQRIFEDAQDYEKFLLILNDLKRQYGFSLYAWCLMPNHIHLLIKEKDIPVSRIMRGLGSRFVHWYNNKYDRTGYLFEGRYLSEPVDDESYFLKVVRYIHMNPVTAMLCQSPEEYPYSSYAYYFKDDRYASNDLIFGLITKDELEQFHKEKNDDSVLEIYKRKQLSDEAASDIIRQAVGNEHIAVVQTLSDEQRERVVLSLLHAGGTIRQISRLTGLTIRTVQYYRDKH